ncbi:alpha/beta hydrolase [Paenibacillus rhizovicinus]|uniref:Alpha/beta hydrolase n=1 Tax=Paenibacillus rhizovicinus TaxID=2704463 RepID=A0A6C0P2D6_9BACL|nr:alpha/beta hydrolase [Paenibacillus rhizovicinus]QHW32013.1 alpha/beta hydrolase [Paenibacillus rhizovicinus]
MTDKPTYTMHHAISADGTAIGYRRLGNGPGLVLIHGAFVSGEDYEKLAAELADVFTVYNVDRRGRLNSGPQGDRYCMERECEDALAVLRATGSKWLFGHSYGGLIALELARTCPDALTKAAVYEPGVSTNGEFPTDWLPAYKNAMARGKSLSAFVYFLKGIGASPEISRMPGWLIKLMLTPSLMSRKGMRLRDKLPNLLHEMNEMLRLDSTVHRYAAITAETLVLAGTKSPEFLLQGARASAAVIPGASLMMMEGMGHNAPDLFNQREISERLKAFFLK